MLKRGASWSISEPHVRTEALLHFYQTNSQGGKTAAGLGSALLDFQGRAAVYRYFSLQSARTMDTTGSLFVQYPTTVSCAGTVAFFLAVRVRIHHSSSWIATQPYGCLLSKALLRICRLQQRHLLFRYFGGPHPDTRSLLSSARATNMHRR